MTPQHQLSMADRIFAYCSKLIETSGRHNLTICRSCYTRLSPHYMFGRRKPEGRRMTKYRERRPNMSDVIGLYEAYTAAEHTYDSIAAIERLRDEGLLIFRPGTGQRKRWERGCDELKGHVNAFYGSSSLDLATVVREFIHEYEHTTQRMWQLLFSLPSDPDIDPKLQALRHWFELIFRKSIYAVTASQDPKKQDVTRISLSVNLSSGKTETDVTPAQMKVPPQYKHTTKKI